MNNATYKYMNDMTDKEWYEKNESFMNRKGAIFNINNNHPFGIVSNGKMICFKTHSFETFQSRGIVSALLNNKHFRTIAELYDNDNVNTCLSFNTLYQAQEYIENFKKEYNLNGSENISFKVELSIDRRTYIPWRRNKDSFQTSSSKDLHYCFDEAIKENPENKVFEHWEEDRKLMNFATKQFDSEVFLIQEKMVQN